jgi:hypothetical protein
MNSTEELLTKQVSYHKTVWSPPLIEVSVQAVLNDIRGGKHARQIDHLRNLLSRGEEDQYSVDKKQLPGVTFSGTFSGTRRGQALKQYSALLVLDIDHINDDELTIAGQALRKDIHVLACWKSPSGNGLKGLVGLSFTKDHEDLDVRIKHRAAFVRVSKHFQDSYGISLDQSGSDVTRLCFLSSDPSLHIRNTIACFTISGIPDSFVPHGARAASLRPENGRTTAETSRGHLLYRTEGKNKPRDRAEMQSIIKFLEKRQLSITGNYDAWVRVAFAIAGTFTYDVGKEYFLRLCRLDGDDHDEDGSISLLESCYETSRGAITFGTVRHYARESGCGKHV